MKGTTEEWTAKAEADYSTAARELKALESPNFDYPGETADHQEATESLDIATRLRTKLRPLLACLSHFRPLRG